MGPKNNMGPSPNKDKDRPPRPDRPNNNSENRQPAQAPGMNKAPAPNDNRK